MIPVADTTYLRSSGYSIQVPFRFPVVLDGENRELVCNRVTRILPGKRLVCFGEFNGQQVVAKFFLDKAGANRHCARELRGIDAFRMSNIKTPKLLVRSIQGSENLPVLCFQRIMPAEDLFEAWEKQTTDEQRIRLLSLAVVAVAEQHEAGLEQIDLHRENFLLSGDDVYSIDGDAVNARRMGRPLSLKRSLKNLALFFTHVYPNQKHLISGVFKAYTEKRGWRFNETLFSQLLRYIRQKKHQRTQRYLSKIYRECTEFICKSDWKRFMVCAREAYTPRMAQLLDDPDQWMDEGTLLKAGNTATLAKVSVDGRDVVIKRYNIKNVRHGLGRFFRPSRAWVSWRNSHFLRYMNIRTPQPIALIERRWGPFRRRAYFITEYVQGTPLNHVFSDRNLDDVDIQSIVEETGILIQALSDQKIGHGDFKASNFIVANGGIAIVDLDAMRVRRYPWTFQRAFKRDVNRFMRNWSGSPEIESQFQKRLFHI